MRRGESLKEFKGSLKGSGTFIVISPFHGFNSAIPILRDFCGFRDFFKLAAGERFERSYAPSKGAVLPLDDPAMAVISNSQVLIFDEFSNTEMFKPETEFV